MTRLSVELNRDGLHQIAAPSSFQTDGPFDIWLQNHDEAIHVHLHLDESLSTVAKLPEGNYFVSANGSRPVRVDTKKINTPVTGRLRIVTAYGAETAYTTITVSPPGTVTKRVEVDERLAEPTPNDPQGSTGIDQLRASLGSEELRPTVGVAGIAVGLALVGAGIAQSVTVLVGSLVAVVAVFVVLAVTRNA